MLHRWFFFVTIYHCVNVYNIIFAIHIYLKDLLQTVKTKHIMFLTDPLYCHYPLPMSWVIYRYETAVSVHAVAPNTC